MYESKTLQFFMLSFKLVLGIMNLRETWCYRILGNINLPAHCRYGSWGRGTSGGEVRESDRSTSLRGSCSSGSYRHWPLKCQPGQLSLTWAVRPGIDSLPEQQFLFVTYIFDSRCTWVTLRNITNIHKDFFFSVVTNQYSIRETMYVQRNSEARSCNHFLQWKIISIT